MLLLLLCFSIPLIVYLWFHYWKQADFVDELKELKQKIMVFFDFFIK